MILLKFVDFAGDEEKLVQLDLITHLADQVGKLHMITSDGTEHVAASSVKALVEALGRIQMPFPPIIIIGL